MRFKKRNRGLTGFNEMFSNEMAGDEMMFSREALDNDM